MQFYRHLNPDSTFAPEIHSFLVEADGEFIFPLKDTDRWTSVPLSYMRDFIKLKAKDVPVHVRRKAGQRLGARRRWAGR